MSGNWGIEVFLAMSEEQAIREGSVRCMRDEFANSEDIYHKLDEIPEALCVSKVIGWQKEICMTKANFMKLIHKVCFGHAYFFLPANDFGKLYEADSELGNDSASFGSGVYSMRRW